MSFLAVYKYISPTLSLRYCPGYGKLSTAKQIEWNTRTNSTIHALMVCIFCLYVLIYEEDVSTDPVWAESEVVKYNCALVVGYMVSDTIIMFIHYNVIGEVFYIFHHGVSIYAYYFVMTYGALPWFANFRLIAEFSTPFVNQRWFLDVLSYPKDSNVFVINGYALTITYFIVRVASIPPYWIKVYSIYGSEPCIRLGRIWYVLLSSCIILDLINLYWFAKVVRGARKVLLSSSSHKKSTAYVARKAA